MMKLIDIRKQIIKNKQINKNSKELQLNDNRRHSFFIVDDIFIDKFARKIGVYATAVYVSLCRHTNSDQMCFPSIVHIADQHGITTRSVIRALNILEQWNIISVDRVKGQSNIYKLLDKSKWKEPADKKWCGSICKGPDVKPEGLKYQLNGSAKQLRRNR